MRQSILIFGHDDTTHFVDIYNQYSQIFPKESYEVTIVYLCSKNEAQTRARTQAEHIIFLNMPKNKIRNLKVEAIQKMHLICKEKKVEIMICHRYKPIYIALWVAQFYPFKKMIGVMHEFKTLSAMGRRLLIALLQKPSMYFAGVSNAVSQDLRQYLIGQIKTRVITLYNALDVKHIEPQLFSRDESRSKLNLPKDAFIFGNVARLVPNKDHATLLKAFAIIKPLCPNAKLVIMGEGHLAPVLKQQIKKLEIENDVILTGQVAHGLRYMKAFDCFVLSSIQEAFGRVLIEAMVAKRPIIATAVDGIPEVMGNLETLIPIKNVEKLAQAMQTTYAKTQSERDLQGQTAYQHLIQHFSLDAFKKQFIARLNIG